MINTIILMGRLTADPDLRTTTSGVSVSSFTVAIDRRYQRQGEEKQTDFIPVIAWRQQADFVTRYFSKGQMIAVEGSLQSRKYEDKFGNPRTAYDVMAERISFCGSRAENGKASTAASYTEAAPTAPTVTQTSMYDDPSVEDDDLPF